MTKLEQQAFLQGFVDKCTQYGYKTATEKVVGDNSTEGVTSAIKDLALYVGASIAMEEPLGAAAKGVVNLDRKYSKKVDRELLKKVMGLKDLNIYDGVADTAFYDHVNKKVHLGKSFKDSSGVLAHELGHAKQRLDLIAPIAITGKLVSPLVGLSSLFTNDKDTSQTLNNVGSLLHVPLVVTELDASRRGYKGLRAVGRSRVGALTAFGGVPSYVGAALLPQIVQKAREHFRTVE